MELGFEEAMKEGRRADADADAAKYGAQPSLVRILTSDDMPVLDLVPVEYTQQHPRQSAHRENQHHIALIEHRSRSENQIGTRNGWTDFFHTAVRLCRNPVCSRSSHVAFPLSIHQCLEIASI